MPRLKTIVAFLTLFVLTLEGGAQTSMIDSLNTVLLTAKDTNRVNTLNKLSSAYWYIDPQKTISFAEEAITLARAKNFNGGLSAAYNNVGVGYYQQNKYADALEWYNKALDMHRQTGNFKREGYVLSNMGLIYWKQGILDTAVQYYLKSLNIWEQHHLEEEKASVFDNLGNVYNEQEDYDRALTHYFKALEIEKKYRKSDHEISMTLSNVGTAYLGKEKYGDALKYFLESLKYLADDEKESRAVSLSNIGLSYIELKDYVNADRYLEEALKLQQETGDNDGMAHTLIGLARTRQKSNDVTSSRNYAMQALDIAKSINDKSVFSEIYVILSELAVAQGDFKNAYSYFQEYVAARDSVRNRENIYKIAHLQAGFETQKKQAEIEALKIERERQAFRRNTVLAGLTALLIIAVLVVSRQRLKIKKNNQLGKINRQLLVQSRKLEDQANKLRELDTVKSTFFANISHEFRTPLTLILNGVADQLTDAKASNDKESIEQLEVMHRNARRLLNLINQLLDLSKLDAGQMKLSKRACDLNGLLRTVHASFSSLARSRNINFTLSLPEEEIHCRLDVDKTEKVLYNLLSNAFKFTPVGGAISLVAERSDGQICIVVQDSGRGIPKDQLEKVFNRFYQGEQHYSDEQGTGIGLALTKELVELHGGSIRAESGERGTSFIVGLPYEQIEAGEELNEEMQAAHLADLTVSPVAATEVAREIGDIEQALPSILLVEDNEDLRNYIRKHLSAAYQVIETDNGKKGLEVAIATIPDLIISDWMMPEMDGITLCHHLKTDERTSHIPIIMLTALASDDAKLKGLATGADDYLTKPFDNRELQVRIHNLIAGRNLLRERFSRELRLGPKNVQVSSMDEKFLERVMETIETYMGDPDFSMEKFGQQVGLSRMQLHRKLKALTGESPGDFLRTMRLKRARTLLESKAGNVSEIAYQVGFNNLSYFSKCYREAYNMAPNETFSAGVTLTSGNVTASADLKD